MIKEQNNWIWHKLNSASRFALANRIFGRVTNNLVVNEYPKSGGTWLSQMLAVATGLPFPMHRLPVLPSQVLQGHYLKPLRMKPVVTIWRDGRDVLLSFYFQRVVGNEYSRSSRAASLRRKLSITDPENVALNLPRFIEHCFRSPQHPRFSWVQFAQVWSQRPDVVQTTYEALKRDTPGELQRVVSQLDFPAISDSQAASISEQFSFRKQKKHQAQPTDGTGRPQFLRKGIVGDWKNHFSLEAAQVFDHFAGETLIQLGYEPDHTWCEAKALRAAG